MTQRETTLLNRNIKLSYASIITGAVAFLGMLGSTMVFVYKGGQYTERFDNRVKNCETASTQLKSEYNVLSYRVGQVETKVAVLQSQNNSSYE